MRYYKILSLVIVFTVLISCINEDSKNDQIIDELTSETNYNKLTEKLVNLKFITDKQFSFGYSKMTPFEGKLFDQKLQLLIIINGDDKAIVSEIIGQSINITKNKNQFQRFIDYFRNYNKIEKDQDIIFKKNNIEILIKKSNTKSGEFTFDIKRYF